MPLLAPVGFLGVVVALFAWQMIAGWDSTFRPMFENLAGALNKADIRVLGRKVLGFGWLASAVLALGDAMRRGLGDFAAGTVAPLVRVLQHAAKLIATAARELEAIPGDVADALWQLRTVIVPGMIAAKVAWIPRHLAALEAEVAGLLRRAPVHIVHDITKVANHYATTIVQKAVAIPFPRIRAVEREAGALGKKIDSLAKKVAPAALAAAIIATIARSSFRFIRCSRTTKAAKHLCGMDDDLLDSLIAGSFLIVGTMSLVEFAEAMQDSMGTIAPQVAKFWRA